MTFLSQRISPLRNRTIARAVIFSGICLAGCDPANEMKDHEHTAAQDQNTAEISSNTRTSNLTEITREGETELDNSNSQPAIMRHAESHVHGAATLALALDGQTISIELESPLYNLVGFEHEPETNQQHNDLRNAESMLSQPGKLLEFNPEAICSAATIGAVELLPSTEHAHNDNELNTDRHHETQKIPSHVDSNNNELDHDHAHKDILLSYTFICQKTDQLRWIDTPIFESFRNLTEIDLVYLGSTKQLSARLTPGSQRFQLVD